MPVSAAQKKASIKYLEKLDEIRIRMEKGKKDDIKTAAVAAGESMNQYIVGAVDARMERDGSPGAAGTPPRAETVSLPSDVLKTAQTAAEAAGETVGDFLARAVSETAERDRLSRNS